MLHKVCIKLSLSRESTAVHCARWYTTLPSNHLLLDGGPPPFGGHLIFILFVILKQNVLTPFEHWFFLYFFIYFYACLSPVSRLLCVKRPHFIWLGTLGLKLAQSFRVWRESQKNCNQSMFLSESNFEEKLFTWTKSQPMWMGGIGVGLRYRAPNSLLLAFFYIQTSLHVGHSEWKNWKNWPLPKVKFFGSIITTGLVIDDLGHF